MTRNPVELVGSIMLYPFNEIRSHRAQVIRKIQDGCKTPRDRLRIRHRRYGEAATKGGRRHEHSRIVG